MGLLDQGGELKVNSSPGDHVVARIPLAAGLGEWSREYQPVARAENIQADVQEGPGGAFLIAQVAAGATRDETADLLEKALGLITTAQARFDEKRSSSATVEQCIRDWWNTKAG